MYFITVIRKLGPDHIFKDMLLADYEDKRCWGYYPTYEMAATVLHDNMTDLCEGYYEYAVVEKIGPGISASVEMSQWFKLDRERHKYLEIEEPECIKHMTNWAIG